jgi:hypothetical protein
MTAKTAAAFAALGILAAGGNSHAASSISVEVGRLEFEGLVVEDLSVDFSPPAASPASVRMQAARIRGIAATGPLSGFSLECTDLRVQGDELSCERGRLTGSLGALGAQDTRFTARRYADGRLDVGLASFAVTGGRGSLDLELAGERWVAEADIANFDVAGLAGVAKPWLALPAGFSVSGKATADVRAHGRGESVAAAAGEIALVSLAFSDAEGMLAGEGLEGEVRFDVEARRDGSMDADGRIALASGQAYSDPVFLDFGEHRADLEFAGTLDPETLRFAADRFALDHEGVLVASGSATLDFEGETLLLESRLRIASLELASAMPAYVQPFLVDTAFQDLGGSGRISGEVDVSAGLPTRAALELDGVRLGSAESALSLSGLRGTVHWFDDATRTRLAGRIDDRLFESQLAWDSGRLWGLELGAAALPFAATGRHFRLLDPVTLPVFDGGLAVETLRVRHAGAPGMYVRFDAAIEPISVGLLSRAFGWPEFQGTLAGSIPGLQLREGVVTLDGDLEASVFDGSVTVSRLSLSEPFGNYPRLMASVDIENLDLALVTRTFEFGMITGRLSGHVRELETFDWMPEAFDAFLYTPPDDESKHRISQRAVTNLSSIGGGSGGGVAAALQGGFLRFFDDFGYGRLGLSCRLANDVCIMGGIEKAGAGYYIVKGAGLPRIDVIGSQTRVAWTTLVRQLAAVMESEIVVE